MNLQGKKIFFLGDSITQGCCTSGENAHFHALIARETGAICHADGIGGTRIARQHNIGHPVDAMDFPSRVGAIDTDADVIVVFGGTNDYGHGDAPIGTPSDRTKDTFWGALHELCTSLLSRFPAAKLVILTPLHRADEDYPLDCGSTVPEAPLKTYVQIIRQVAEYYSLPVLDLYAYSGMQPAVPAIRQRYMPDGLHPNDAGHAILAEKIISFLKQL